MHDGQADRQKQTNSKLSPSTDVNVRKWGVGEGEAGEADGRFGCIA